MYAVIKAQRRRLHCQHSAAPADWCGAAWEAVCSERVSERPPSCGSDKIKNIKLHTLHNNCVLIHASTHWRGYWLIFNESLKSFFPSLDTVITAATSSLFCFLQRMINKIKTIHYFFFHLMHSVAAKRRVRRRTRCVFTAVPSAAWNWQYVGWPDESFLMRQNHLVIYELTHRLFLQPGINLWETRLRLGTRLTTEPARPLDKVTSPLRLTATVCDCCSSTSPRWDSKKERPLVPCCPPCVQPEIQKDDGHYLNSRCCFYLAGNNCGSSSVHDGWNQACRAQRQVALAGPSRVRGTGATEKLFNIAFN